MRGSGDVPLRMHLARERRLVLRFAPCKRRWGKHSGPRECDGEPDDVGAMHECLPSRGRGAAAGVSRLAERGRPTASPAVSPVNLAANGLIYLARLRWYGRYTVEFRLLGVLEVTGDDGRTVEIVRGHESGLLALLLLHANEALSPERIVEELWSGAPPENARKSVHIYVSRLRKALGSERIETTRAGYLLRVAPDELDVSHFVSLATEGREALDRGSPEEAESVFDRALALWRVAPLADFRFEAFAQA